MSGEDKEAPGIGQVADTIKPVSNRDQSHILGEVLASDSTARNFEYYQAAFGYNAENLKGKKF